MGELRKELIRLANTRDVNVEYICESRVAPFLDDRTGQVNYVGDTGKLRVNVSDKSLGCSQHAGVSFLIEDFAAMAALEQGLFKTMLLAVSQV